MTYHLIPFLTILAIITEGCIPYDENIAYKGSLTVPNREQLIAYPFRVNGHQQIFTIKIDGADKRHLTFIGNNAMPSWSPDGNKIAFTRRMGLNVEIWVMGADGSNQQLLIENGQAADWGKNDQIVYTGSVNGKAELFVHDLTNHYSRQLTFSTGSFHPSWSPDSKYIAFARVESQLYDDTSNNCPALPIAPDIWIINSDGTNEYKPTDSDQFFNIGVLSDTINSAFDANAPDWSPNSTEIAFWSGQESCFGQVWKIDVNRQNRTQLTKAPLPSHNDDPAWSSDGTKILFSTDRNGRAELWVMNADGSNPHFIAEVSPGPLPADAAWQP